jgi:UDP-N-acetylmuramate--alanine ligase
MLAAILEEAKCAYTAHIGGIIAGQASGTVICGNDIFLTEACEYKRHFLRLKPTLGIVTNVEHDHPDCYADLNAVYDAFGAFARQCQAVVTKDVRIISTLAHTNTFTYSQWSIRPTDINANTYQLTCGYEQLALRLNVWGDFNMQNAAFAAVSALSQGIAPDVIQRGLAAYRGIERRQQYMGQYRGMPIISDYAHHPSEIYAVTAAASRRYGDIAVVYEPHTYSRTMALMKEFGTCFVASAVYLLPTFAAREAPEKGVDEALLEAITVKDKHYADREQTMEALKKMPYKKYGAILLVGAGTVHDFAKQVAALEQE